MEGRYNSDQWRRDDYVSKSLDWFGVACGIGRGKCGNRLARAAGRLRMGTVTQLFETSQLASPRGAQMLDLLILAKSSTENVHVSPADKSLSLEWGLILAGLIIGLAITLMPPKRTYEVKKRKEE